LAQEICEEIGKVRDCHMSSVLNGAAESSGWLNARLLHC